MKNAAIATGAPVGFDAGKLVKGRKRLVLADTLGHVLANCVVPGNAMDGAAAIAFWDEVVATHDLLSQVQVVFVNSSFNGVLRKYLSHCYGVRVEKPAHVLVKNQFLQLCLAVDCWAHVLGSVPTADFPRNMTGPCATPMRGLPWQTSGVFSNAANSNSFLEAV